MYKFKLLVENNEGKIEEFYLGDFYIYKTKDDIDDVNNVLNILSPFLFLLETNFGSTGFTIWKALVTLVKGIKNEQKKEVQKHMDILFNEIQSASIKNILQ